jgi:hypothetical protein
LFSIPGAAWMRDGKDIIYARHETPYRGVLDRIRADSGAVLEDLRYTHNAPTLPFSIAVASRGTIPGAIYATFAYSLDRCVLT